MRVRSCLVSLAAAILLFFVKLSYGAFDADYELLNAARDGDVPKIHEMLGRGASMSTRNNFGVSPLIFSANNGHLEAIQTLLDLGAEIDAVSNNGRTPLNWACLWGHLEIVRYLIERGADTEAPDIDGMTPIMNAVRSGNKELVELLLEQGVIVSSANNFNGTALSIARVKRLPEVIELLEPFFEPDEETSPYKVAFQIAFKSIVRSIRYVNLKIRKLTGLFPGEWTDEL